MSELNQKIEALLFSSGRGMSIEELSRLCRASEEDVLKALKEIQYEYNKRDSPIVVVNEGQNWKQITKEKYLDIVRKIVSKTELTKSVMETLAVIAFRYPIKQSDLIKIRSNKAYDHLKQLEELDYISRQKHGRTKLIKLTQKFFDYFDLPPEKLKEKFHDFESIEKAIEEKEKEIERITEEQKQKSKKEKKEQEEEHKKVDREIDLIDEEGNKVELEVVDEKKSVNNENKLQKQEEPKIKIEKEKIGELEVVDEPEDKLEEYNEEHLESYEEGETKGKDESDNADEIRTKKKKNLKPISKIDELAEKRAEEILNPKEESDSFDPNEESNDKGSSDEAISSDEDSSAVKTLFGEQEHITQDAEPAEESSETGMPSEEQEEEKN